jgi:hypothetical protein
MEKLGIRDYSNPGDSLIIEEDAGHGTKTGAVALTCYGMGDNATVLIDQAGVINLFNWLSAWLLQTAPDKRPMIDPLNPAGRIVEDETGAYVVKPDPAPRIVPYEPLEDEAPSAAVCAAPPLTGTLRYARWEPEHRRAPCLTGQVYGHKRFPNGSVVWTSRVVEHMGGNLFRTLSGSIYAVEWDAGNAGEWPASLVRTD